MKSALVVCLVAMRLASPESSGAEWQDFDVLLVMDHNTNETRAAVAEQNVELVDDAMQQGILIVPPDDDDHYTRLFDTALNLSLPGTESMPSDVGSLQVSSLLHPHPRAPTTTRIHRPSGWLVVGGGLVLILSMASNVYLLHERTKIRQQIQNLTQTLEQHRRKAQQQQKQKFQWDGGNWNSPPDDTTLVDNCWLHAKANVQLGHCAQEAKHRVVQDWQTLRRSLGKWQQQAADQWNAWVVGTTTADTEASPSTLREAMRQGATVLASGALVATVSHWIAKNDAPLEDVWNGFRDILQGGSTHSEED